MATLVCAACTVVFFIMSQLNEGEWRWGDEDLSLEFTSAFFTGMYQYTGEKKGLQISSLFVSLSHFSALINLIMTYLPEQFFRKLNIVKDKSFYSCN